LVVFFVMFAFSALNVTASTLQELINQTPTGGKVPLEPGTYFGPVVIDRPIILDGKGKVTIDGQAKGTVIRIVANGVTIRNMNITGSGKSHDQVHAGISVTSSYNIIRNNRIHHTLFGIDMKESHENEIIENDISSFPEDLGLRGDGIRVWASNNNVFRKNSIHDSRDMIIWYSDGNLIEYNKGWNNRYSLHFMYTGGNTVRYNNYWDSAVGIFLMYSHDSVLSHNQIRHAIGTTGMGIGMKEVDNMRLIENRIVYCTTGIYLDQSPFDPLAFNMMLGNTVAYNIHGVVFHSTLKQNVFKGNQFIGNLEAITVHSKGTANNNIWEANYWSEYEGFDRDSNGYGDSSYINKIYLDQLWMDNPWVKFYYASPVLSGLNLLAKLAPLSEPKLLMIDTKPIFLENDPQRLSAEILDYQPPEIDEDDLDEYWDENN
jgi:nitrous oxidase accessory protein